MSRAALETIGNATSQVVKDGHVLSEVLPSLAERTAEFLRSGKFAGREANNAAEPVSTFALARVFPNDEASAAINALRSDSKMQRPAVVLSGGGNMLTAHSGVTELLQERGLLTDKTHVIGVSAGSVHQAFRLAGVPWHEQQSVLNEAFGVHPYFDLANLSWQLSPFRSALGDGAMDAVKRNPLLPTVVVDEALKSMEQVAKSFAPWSLGFDTALSNLRYLNREIGRPFDSVDFSPVDTLDGWRKVAKRLDLDRILDKNSSFLAYDPKAKRVVQFRGGPGDYDAATMLAATTAFNDVGIGVKPVETIVNGHTVKLIDLGLEHNHPTWHLPANQPAIISRLFKNGPNRDGLDLVIPATLREAHPFDRVFKSDIQGLHDNAYQSARTIVDEFLKK